MIPVTKAKFRFGYGAGEGKPGPVAVAAEVRSSARSAISSCATVLRTSSGSRAIPTC